MTSLCDQMDIMRGEKSRIRRVVQIGTTMRRMRIRMRIGIRIRRGIRIGRINVNENE